ncbi:MAG TPA: two-component regulator propeller domain-containing protein [Luteibacter sp.]|nr:two-component regulator propeller domain-containing protein [Luteibacter sp.]
MFRIIVVALWLFAGMASAKPVSPATLRPAESAGLLPTPQFRRFGLFNDLPSSTVLDVAQDRDGFIWIGTDVGLVRYDGAEFETFVNDPNDRSSLSANHVSIVFVDRDGGVWVGGEGGGLNRYEADRRGFSRWHGDGDVHPGHDLIAIAQTGDGAIWVAMRDTGLAWKRADGHQFERLATLPEGWEPGKITSLLAGSRGGLWIGSTAGLAWRGADGGIREVLTREGESLPPVNRIEGEGADIRVGTDRGLFHVGADAVAHRDSRVSADLRALSSEVDPAGRLWIGSDAGLRMIDHDGKSHAFLARPLLPGGLPGTRVRRIFADREGGLWFGFEYGGLAYLGPNWNAMSRFTHIPDDPGSLPSPPVTVLAASNDGRLWVGGEGWLRKLDPSSGRFEVIPGQENTSVTALLEDRRGGLWIGTDNGLYVRRHGISRRVGEALLHAPVTELIEDVAGNVYAASTEDHAMAVFDSVTLSSSTIPLAVQPTDRQVTRQIVLRGERLWRASDSGLSRWDPLRSRQVFVPGVGTGRVDAIAFDATGFWLARPGVLEHYAWDEDSEVAARDRVVGRSEGLPTSGIVSLRVDRGNGVWLFGAKGLWCFAPETGHFRQYGLSDGLFNREFNGSRTIELDDGVVYATTFGGLVAMRMGTHAKSLYAPAPIVTGLDVRRAGAMHAMALSLTTIGLRWDDRELRVQVRSLSYVSSELRRYRFRLDGLDKDWVETGGRGEREFAGLSPGNYRLYIEATADGQSWTAIDRPLTMLVEAPPWQRWWAWLSYIAAAVVALLSALHATHRRLRHRLRVQHAEHQRELAEATSEAKTRFMATLGHEIRTPMTGILGMAELMRQTSLSPTQQEYVDALQRSGSLLLRLVNDVLDLARLDACRVELEQAPFNPRALVGETIRLHAAAALRKKLTLVDDCTADLPANVLGDATRIKQVLLNLVGNAIKFTARGGASLRAVRTEGGIAFIVTDTGPGIADEVRRRLFQRFEQGATPQREFGTGLGLAICRELVVLMGGRIWLDPGADQGSRFHVWLPLRECKVEAPAAVGAEKATADPLDILLVEDDPIVAAVISGLLDAQGHHVRHVAHSLGALTELAVAQPAVVLLDLDLPGVDGFQLAGMIRRLHGALHLPIYAVTARSVGDEEALTRAAGMNGFLRKPVTGEQLAALLAPLVEQDDATCRIS